MKAFIISLYVLLFTTVVLASVLPVVLKPNRAQLRVHSNKVRVLPYNIAVCTPIRDCEKYLPQVFENIDRLRPYFKSLHSIFVYDNCSDKSADLLQHYKRPNVIVYHNIGNNHKERTVRIASSRNVIVDLIYNHLPSIDFHIMFDADDRNVDKWDVDVILESLQRNDWDSLSFNEPQYYDIWALFYDKFKHHCFGWIDKSPKSKEPYIFTKVIEYMRKDIQKKLKQLPSPNHLLEVLSAFNSFALYRTSVFRGLQYDGTYKGVTKYFSDQDRAETLEHLQQVLPAEDADRIKLRDDIFEQADHVSYHLDAIKNRGARIRISPKYWRT